LDLDDSLSNWFIFSFDAVVGSAVASAESTFISFGSIGRIRAFESKAIPKMALHVYMVVLYRYGVGSIVPAGAISSNLRMIQIHNQKLQNLTKKNKNFLPLL
jgi:hypothetical protein